MKVIDLQRTNALQQKEARRLNAIKAAAHAAALEGNRIRIARIANIMRREASSVVFMEEAGNRTVQCFVNTF